MRITRHATALDARFRGSPGFPAFFQRIGVDQQIDLFVGDIDEDLIALLDESNRPTYRSLRRDLSDSSARSASTEPAIGHQGNVFPQTHANDRCRGGIGLVGLGTSEYD